MGLLVDWQIRDLCYPLDAMQEPMIDPFTESVSGGGVVSYGLTHAGYDIRLANEFLIFKNSYNEVIDPRLFMDENYKARIFDKITQDYQFIIPPHSYVLVRSLEYLRIPRTLKARCVGKSTWARCGLICNTTPLEPSWHGHLMIELGNVSPCPIRLPVGEGIAQLEFETLNGECKTSYAEKENGHGGKYQGQTGMTVAKVL
jgi:dCTP deaminase